MTGVSTPHEPRTNQYGAKGLSCQIIITLYYGAGETKTVLNKIIIICRREVKTSTKTRGEEKINLPNKAHDTR